MLINNLIASILVLFSFSIQAQESKLKLDKDLGLSQYAVINYEKALEDIEHGNMILYIKGGLGVKHKAFNKQDSIFQATYSVSYFPKGCLSFTGDDYKSYNRTIINYLKKEMDLKNKRKLHPNVIGK